MSATFVRSNARAATLKAPFGAVFAAQRKEPRMARQRRKKSGTDRQHYEDTDEPTLSRHLELGRYDEDDVATLPWLPLVDRGAPNMR
jgi:hypothetical protein